MTVTLRGTSISGANDGPGQVSSKATAVPAGTLTDDIAVLIVGLWASAGQAAPTVTWPAGFAGHEFLSVTVAVPSGGNLWLKMAWASSGKSLSGSWTPSFNTSYWCMVASHVWYDTAGTIDGAAPIEATNTSTNGASTTAVADTSVTTTDLAGLGHAFQSYNDATAAVQPTGYTKDDGGATVLHVSHKTATATGTQTATGATTGSVSTVKVAGLYAVKAAAAGGTALNLAAAAETDAAQVWSLTKAGSLQVSTESGTAQPLSSSKALALAAATESGTAHPMTFTKGVALARATETDAAQPLSYAGTSQLALARATETDTARPVGLVKAPVLARATGTDTALAGTLAKAPVFGRALEADAAHPMTFAKGLLFGRATETDTARVADFGQLPPYTPAETWTAVTRPAATAQTRPRTHTAVTRPRTFTAETLEH